MTKILTTLSITCLCLRTVAAFEVEILPPALRGAVQPQVAVAPDGRTFIAFGKGGSLYAAAGDASLVFRAPVEIATLPKLALGMRRGPRITAGRTIVVSAISHEEGNLYGGVPRTAGPSGLPPRA